MRLLSLTVLLTAVLLVMAAPLAVFASETP
jgi:hypothetical protein